MYVYLPVCKYIYIYVCMYGCVSSSKIKLFQIKLATGKSLLLYFWPGASLQVYVYVCVCVCVEIALLHNICWLFIIEKRRVKTTTLH